MTKRSVFDYAHVISPINYRCDISFNNIYEEFKFKNRYINFFFFNLRYLRLKLLKNEENNKKTCHIFHHNKDIPCYVMSEVSLKRFYFALFDDGLTLKTLKLAFIGFLIQTLHYYSCYSNSN